MGDEETYKIMDTGKLFVGIPGQPLQELENPVKCDLLSCCHTPYTESSKFDFRKKSFEASFDIASNPEIEKLQETLLKASEDAMHEFFKKIESFCSILVEDFLGIKFDDFTKDQAIHHGMATVWNDKQDSFYGLLMDGKLYSVSGLLFNWTEDSHITLYDVANPYWANEKIVEKLKSLNIEC